MDKKRFTYKDIHIGDFIETTNNTVGEVIAIKSYAYLNDKLARKADNSLIMIDLMPYQNDNVRHKDVWYSAITIAVKDKKASRPTYFLEALDFTEIAEIKSVTVEKESLLGKLKKVFKK